MTPLLDSVGMFDLAAAPARAGGGGRRAGRRARATCPTTTPSSTSSCSAWAAAASRATSSRRWRRRSCPCPSRSCSGYEAPRFVSEGTLCFAVSYSGNTEETVEAAQAAAAAGARMVVLSTGGELAELAAAWDAPHIPLPDIPMPRAGIGAVEHPAAPRARARRAVPRRRGQESTRRSPSSGAAGTSSSSTGSAAHRLAEEIGRTIPLAYGGDAIGEVAAYRFKCQVNENAKAPAFSAGRARDVPQRDLRLGPARRRHPAGDDRRPVPARLRAPAGGPALRPHPRRARRGRPRHHRRRRPRARVPWPSCSTS